METVHTLVYSSRQILDRCHWLLDELEELLLGIEPMSTEQIRRRAMVPSDADHFALEREAACSSSKSDGLSFLGEDRVLRRITVTSSALGVFAFNDCGSSVDVDCTIGSSLMPTPPGPRLFAVQTGQTCGSFTFSVVSP